MNPTQILKKQHREVEALFKKIEKTTGASQRRALLGQLSDSLKLHMQIEEKVFYPAVKELETKNAEEMVLEAYEEHAVVKLVLAELPKLDPMMSGLRPS
jgi:iron-sulfur cluster repair protein YtfE (RIC family)